MQKISYLRVILLFIVFQTPVFLLFFNVTDYTCRYWFLGACSILIFTYAILRRFSLREFGIRTDNFLNSLKYNIVFSIFVIILILSFYRFDLLREPTIPDWRFFFIFYIFISSPLQEFLFRSLVFAELRRLKMHDALTIILSSLNYGLMHIFYHDLTTFLSALIIGFFLGYIYFKTDNLYGISISHAAIGTISIYTGLI